MLRIFLNDGQPHVIAEAARAISQLAPKRVGFSRIGRRVVVVRMYWGGWPLMLPQHGHGRKHRRPIVLEPWQEKLVATHPDQFLRGCIHSDVAGIDASSGARTIRHTDSPTARRTSSSRVAMSIARRPDVARLDAIMAKAWSAQSQEATVTG